MKRTLFRISLLFILVFACRQGFAQFGPAIKWQKCLGGTRDDIAYDVALTPDGGFIIVGSSNSINGDVTGHHGAVDTADGWVVKLDASGAIQWQKSIGGSSVDYFTSVVPTTDNAYLCVGTTSSNDGDVSGNHGGADYWVVKISNTGTVLWSKCFGGSNIEYISHGIATYDGGFAIIGNTRSQDGDITNYPAGSPGSDVAWLVRLSSAGTLLWQKCYGTFSGNRPTVAEDANHNFLLGLHAGSSSTSFPIVNTHDNYFVRAGKDSGNVIKSVFDPNTSYTANTSFARTGTGFLAGFLTAPQYPISGSASTTYMLDTGINVLGTMITPYSLHSYGISYNSIFSGVNGIAALSDTSFIGAGVLYDDGTGATGMYGGTGDACIGIGRYIGGSGKTPPAQTKYFYQKYGGSQYETFNSVKVLQSGNDYIAVGYTNSNNYDVSGNHGGSDCWVVRLAGANSITGKIFLDYNGNGIRDAGDTDFDNVIVKSVKPGFTQYGLPYHGSYQNDVDTGTFTTTVITAKPYYIVRPAAKTSTFTTYKNTDTANFAVQPIAGERDYAVSCITSLAFRPATPLVIYVVTYSNNGTDTLVNKKVYFIKDHRSTFSGSTPVNTGISGDTISWNIASLLPGSKGNINLQFKLDSVPSLTIGDTVTARVYIDSTGDVYPSDNTTWIRRIVTNSYDPNDKQESNGGFISPKDISDRKDLTYNIRFQNTGNDTAFTVIVRDTLDAKVDPATMQMIDASHPYQFNIRDGKYCTWVFSNILLPDSIHNEPLSHGYLTYRIKPQASLAVGDTIHNSASIYFDFNPAVKTSTQLTVVQLLVPAQPVVTGLQSSYCSNLAAQKIKITNIPDVSYKATTTVVLDGSVSLTVAADSTFSINPSSIAAGSHMVIIAFTNAGGATKDTLNFSITQAVTPDVNVSASTYLVTSLADNLVITAVNAAGGGTSPLYTFAKDRAISNILQAESAANTLTMAPTTLAVGSNWIYVRMKTSSSCYTVQTNIDSVKIDRSSITGLVDIDNPGQVITIYPNPFVQTINISGLSASKTYSIRISDAAGQELYRQQVGNSTHITINNALFQSGNYWLRIYDVKKKRLIGASLLLKY